MPVSPYTLPNLGVIWGRGGGGLRRGHIGPTE